MAPFLENKRNELYEGKEIFSGRMGFDFVPYYDDADVEKQDEKIVIAEFGGSNCILWDMKPEEFKTGDSLSEMRQESMLPIDSSKKQELLSLYWKLLWQNIENIENENERLDVTKLMENLTWGKFIDWFERKDKNISKEKQDILFFLFEKYLIYDCFDNLKPDHHTLSMVASDKVAQQSFIDEKYKPKSFNPGTNRHSRTGFWILKPRLSYGQRGIIKLSNEELLEWNNLKIISSEKYLVQELFPAAGSKNVDPNFKDRPSFVRLVIDFKVIKDKKGELRVIFEGSAFNQMSIIKNREGMSDNLPSWVTANLSGPKKGSMPPKDLQKKCLDAAESTIINVAKFIDPENPEDINFEVL